MPEHPNSAHDGEAGSVPSMVGLGQAEGGLIAGVDVGRYHCQLCIMERDTGECTEVRVSSAAEAIAETLAPYQGRIQHVVMEATANSFELCRRLLALRYPAILVDPRNAAPFLRAYRQAKTDKNDAYRLAQLVAHGAQRIVWVRSAESGELAAMLATRDALIKAEVALRNALGSHLDASGFTVKSRGRAKYLRLFEEGLKQIKGYSFLGLLYDMLMQLNTQVVALNKALNEKARKGANSKLLMTIPGIGPLTALRFISVIDYPARFAKSRDVGPYLGLVPRVRQSGEVVKLGRLTRRGSNELRKSLFLCGQVVLTRSRKDSPMRDWARRVARRRGTKRAIVALARKLAVVMHAVWISGQPYKG